MTLENPYESPHVEDTTKDVSSSYGFRPLVLFACIIGGAVIMSAVIGLSSNPPPREMLGDADYYRTWAMIIAGGAIVGALNYFWVHYLIVRWPRSKRKDD